MDLHDEWLSSTRKYIKFDQWETGKTLYSILHRIMDLTYELDPSPLINRLVNYLYFTAYTNKIRFTEYQEELIRNLSEIGRTAGINGLYRADYGDKSQF